MASRRMSLRAMIEHWLGPDPGKPIRFAKLKNSRSMQMPFSVDRPYPSPGFGGGRKDSIRSTIHKID